MGWVGNNCLFCFPVGVLEGRWLFKTAGGGEQYVVGTACQQDFMWEGVTSPPPPHFPQKKFCIWACGMCTAAHADWVLQTPVILAGKLPCTIPLLLNGSLSLAPFICCRNFCHVTSSAPPSRKLQDISDANNDVGGMCRLKNSHAA